MFNDNDMLSGMDDLLGQLGIDSGEFGGIENFTEKLRISTPHNSKDIAKAVKLLGWDVQNISEHNTPLEPIGFVGNTPIIYNSICCSPSDLDDSFFYGLLEDLSSNLNDYDQIIFLTGGPLVISQEKKGEKELKLLILGVIYDENSMEWSWLIHNSKDPDLSKQLNVYPCETDFEFNFNDDDIDYAVSNDIVFAYGDLINKAKSEFLERAMSGGEFKG
ncbi:MAG: hypothetical protein HRU38_10825 [Saccharospirillaceae bacterium]|nr:hypothetical protein [Saccharospirillaceae bacterium]